MHPWYRNFEGDISEEVVKGETRYVIKGKYEISEDNTTLTISELPVRSWTTDYKEFLETLMNPKEKNATPFITDYKEYHTDATVKFVVTMIAGEDGAGAEGGRREEVQAHHARVHVQHAPLRREGRDREVPVPGGDHGGVRAPAPTRTRDARAMLIRHAESELKRMSNKVRFILAVVDDELTIGRKKKSVLVDELEAMGFDRMPKSQKAAAALAQETLGRRGAPKAPRRAPSPPPTPPTPVRATTTSSPCRCGTSPRRRWTSSSRSSA